MDFNKLVSHIASIQNNNSFNLWHYRLGHLSHNRIPYLKHLHSTIVNLP
ncbi:hypothetical protein LINPERPRIM_LOCUS5441 [Linum perenne]